MIPFCHSPFPHVFVFHLPVFMANHFAPCLDFGPARFTMPKSKGRFSTSDAPALFVKLPLIFGRLRSVCFALKESGISFADWLLIPSLAL